MFMVLMQLNWSFIGILQNGDRYKELPRLSACECSPGRSANMGNENF